MADIIWLKQEPGKPLFPDILWTRPENKRAAGKLLIIGGNLHAFSAVSSAYTRAVKAGAGTVRAVLPDSLEKSLGKIFPEASFAPSTPSGSFAKIALAQLLEEASWADGVLLPGDFGRNSETAVLLELFVEKYHGPLILAGDTIDYFIEQSQKLLSRPLTCLVASIPQLQKLFKANPLHKPILQTMTLHEMINILGQLSLSAKPTIVTGHEANLIIASSGTSISQKDSRTLSDIVSEISVFMIQSPAKLFEASVTAVYEEV